MSSEGSNVEAARRSLNLQIRESVDMQRAHEDCVFASSISVSLCLHSLLRSLVEDCLESCCTICARRRWLRSLCARLPVHHHSLHPLSLLPIIPCRPSPQHTIPVDPYLSIPRVFGWATRQCGLTVSIDLWKCVCRFALRQQYLSSGGFSTSSDLQQTQRPPCWGVEALLAVRSLHPFLLVLPFRKSLLTCLCLPSFSQ